MLFKTWESLIGLIELAIALTLISGYLSRRMQGQSAIDSMIDPTASFTDIPRSLLDKVTDLYDIIDAAIENNPKVLGVLLDESESYKFVQSAMKELGEKVDIANAQKLAKDLMYDSHIHDQKVADGLPKDAIVRADAVLEEIGKAATKKDPLQRPEPKKGKS